MGITAKPKIDKLVDGLSDDDLQILATSMVNTWSNPVRENNELVDEDGFSVRPSPDDDLSNFSDLQKKCWEKFNKNPQINSHVRDYMGSLTGYGFSVDSEVWELQEFIEEVGEDIRNEFHKNITKWVARAEIEGELFLGLSLHTDGFVEVDFLEPSALSGNGDNGSGIYFHPRKSTMPIFYEFRVKKENGKNEDILVPSIYVAYNPAYATETAAANKELRKKVDSYVKGKGVKYKKIGGYKTFVVAWDRGFLTKRNVSHIKTTLVWLNHYTNLKKWEIDHKKSSGAYLWVIEMTDMAAFRTWLKMTDEQKKESGLTAKKTPGGTLMLPPGVRLQCVNPQLASISEQDTDIMHMVTSGLNKPEDMVTGQTKGDTFSGIKASRGPQADRVRDELSYFERFLRFDFWRSIFYLHSVMKSSFKLEHKVKKTIGFGKDGKPKKKNVTVKAHKLLNFWFPTSEIVDVESKARAFLGVNHQSVCETLGIPRAMVAEKLGFHGYKKLRADYQTEEDSLPELPLTGDIMEQTAASGQQVKQTPVNSDTKNNSTNKENNSNNKEN